MKSSHAALGALALVVLVAGAAYAWHRAQAGPDAADAPDAAPVAAVRLAVPARRELPESIELVGEVEPAQLAGLSFAPAGQLVALRALAGSRVVRGQVLATLAPDPASVQAWEQARTAADQARREADRQRQLRAEQLATNSQVDAAEKAAQDAQSALAALVRQGGGRGELTLVAPFDGVVASVAAVQGDRLAAGAEVLQLGRTDLRRARFGVEPAQAARVHAGQAVTLAEIAPATAGAPAAEVPGRVAEVAAGVDPKTRLVDVLVAISPAASASAPPPMPGAAVRGELVLGRHDGLAVPRDAVLNDDRGDYLFQVVGGKARRVAVKKTIESQGWVGLAGLADPALPVVVTGNYELEDGMAVRDAAR